jgi:co-chaperonin GroES (HSP10)
MNLVPKSGQILVRPIAHKPAQTGLVQLADVYYEPDTSGVVIALAERFACPHCAAEKPPQVQVGECVIFPPSAGSQFELDGTTYLLLLEDDVLAVVAPDVACEVV